MANTLWDEMGCARCEYRMKSSPGCFKFGLTREEVNKKPWIETLRQGAFIMDASKKCPYAERN